MRCKKFYDIISAFVDSEANALEQAALQEHLKSCDICKKELTSQYTLKQMLKDCQCSNHDIDISSSVMSRIMNKNSLDSLLDNAMVVDGPLTRKPLKLRWAAAAFICAITMAAVFSTNKINSQIAAVDVSDNVVDYTTYIYEHLNTPNLDYTTSSDPQLSRVSFIK